MKLKKIKAPNTFLIIFSLIIVIAAMTWIIPAGEFDKIEVDGHKVIDGDSFHYVEQSPQGIGDILTSPIDGFVDAAIIIGFVLIVGGAFGIFQRTEAVDSGIKSLANAYHDSKFIRAVLIPLFMFIFAVGGATFGMSEETIPFVMIFVPMALTLGYDSITGVAIPFVGAGAGFAGAFANPFTVGIAQGIAGLPPFSGIGYRVVVWLIITGIAITFVKIYAERIKKNPEKSLTYEIDKKKRENLDTTHLENFEGMDKEHKRVLVTFAAGLAVLVFGVLQYGWYIAEISAVFLATGIAVGIVGKLSINEITESFVVGAKDLVATALIIALARAILVVAEDGHIIDTMLYHLSSVVDKFHPVISTHVMFFIQSALNFFVPSGSGQAALTMPIMAPLSDLVGVSRQTAVLAYQFGDGFTNLIIPTSAVLMGALTLAGIPWDKWARWMLPLQIIFIVLGVLLLIPPFFIGW